MVMSDGEPAFVLYRTLTAEWIILRKLINRQRITIFAWLMRAAGFLGRCLRYSRCENCGPQYSFFFFFKEK
jgi:hypothetical protein